MIHFKNIDEYATFVNKRITHQGVVKDDVATAKVKRTKSNQRLCGLTTNPSQARVLTQKGQKRARRALIPPQPREHDIQTAIMQWFIRNKWFCWRNNSGMIAVGSGRYRRMIKLGKAGMPDVLAIKDGIFAAVEVKRPGNKPTVLQEQTIAELNSYGAWAIVAYSIDDVIKKFSIV